MKATIWHNPRCSKSRQALALLQDSGAEVTVFEYLKEKLSPEALRQIFARAGITPRQGMRGGEPGAAALKHASDEQIVEAMVLDPILIERPLVMTEKGAVLGRPPELVREIL